MGTSHSSPRRPARQWSAAIAPPQATKATCRRRRFERTPTLARRGSSGRFRAWPPASRPCSALRRSRGRKLAARRSKGSSCAPCARRSDELRGEAAQTPPAPPAPRCPERAREPVQLGCTLGRRFGRALRTSSACGRLCLTDLPPLCLAGRGCSAEHMRRFYGSQRRHQSAHCSIGRIGAPAPMSRLGALIGHGSPFGPS